MEGWSQLEIPFMGQAGYNSGSRYHVHRNVGPDALYHSGFLGDTLHIFFKINAVIGCTDGIVISLPTYLSHIMR